MILCILGNPYARTTEEPLGYTLSYSVLVIYIYIYTLVVVDHNMARARARARADTGCRPLITMIIKRFISYFKSLQNRKSNLCYDAFVFETENTVSPNFCKFAENFNLDIKELTSQSEEKVHKICTGSYDRFWKTTISESGKASSFNKFKTNIALEPHLDLHLNLKYKIAISRFRLSNHTLMIEKR